MVGCSEVIDDGVMNGDGASSETCSICLDLVSDDGSRSTARLQCGHRFHLDCIGSAFNMKGEMQCPNCRKIERGRWLFGNGSTRSFPEMTMDDWIPDEDPYDISYPEMPFRFHWCPFNGLTRVRSVFEDVESPSTTYRGLQGHHSVFAEHTAASSVAHSFVAYFGPIAPTSSNNSESVDDPNFNRPWNGLSVHNEIFSPHAFQAIDIQYQNWGRHSPSFSPTGSQVNSVDQASVPPASTGPRSSRGDSDTRPGAFVHPFPFGHGLGPRGGSSFVSPIVPRHPGSTLTQERIQVPHAFHHQQQPGNPPVMPPPIIPGMRRFNGPRGLPPVVASQSDHNGGFYIFPPPNSSGRNIHDAENPLPNHVHAWERDRLSRFPLNSHDRDSGWVPFHQATDGSDSSNRSSSFWPRHWS